MKYVAAASAEYEYYIYFRMFQWADAIDLMSFMCPKIAVRCSILKPKWTNNVKLLHCLICQNQVIPALICWFDRWADGFFRLDLFFGGVRTCIWYGHIWISIQPHISHAFKPHRDFGTPFFTEYKYIVRLNFFVPKPRISWDRHCIFVFFFNFILNLFAYAMISNG